MNLAITVGEAHGAIRADTAIEIAPEIFHHQTVTPFTTIAVAISAMVTRRIDEFLADRTGRTVVVMGLGILEIGAPMMNRVRCAAMDRLRFFRRGRSGEQKRETCADSHGIETKIHRPNPFMPSAPATGHCVNMVQSTGSERGESGDRTYG